MLNHAGALITQRDWLKHAVRLAAGDSGGANSSSGDAYQDLVVPHLIKIELFDRIGLMWCAGYISLNAQGPAERR